MNFGDLAAGDAHRPDLSRTLDPRPFTPEHYGQLFVTIIPGSVQSICQHGSGVATVGDQECCPDSERAQIGPDQELFSSSGVSGCAGRSVDRESRSGLTVGGRSPIR